MAVYGPSTLFMAVLGASTLFMVVNAIATHYKYDKIPFSSCQLTFNLKAQNWLYKVPLCSVKLSKTEHMILFGES